MWKMWKDSNGSNVKIKKTKWSCEMIFEMWLEEWNTINKVEEK